jgi:hypothetical protein
MCRSCRGKPIGQRGCKFDIVQTHMYACSAAVFDRYLNYRVGKLGLPIWVTEVGCYPAWCVSNGLGGRLGSGCQALA